MNGSELKTQIKKATQFSQCIFHDTNECSSKIINGHSISKSKILDTLSQDAFVYIPNVKTMHDFGSLITSQSTMLQKKSFKRKD